MTVFSLVAGGAINTPLIVELPDGVPVVEKRHAAVTMSDLREVFDAGFRQLSALDPVGPGYAIYIGAGQAMHDGDLEAPFDLTLGFPVGSIDATLPDGVEFSTFPGGRAVAVSHIGPYEGLPNAWREFTTHEQAAGRNRVIEVYVSDPTQTAAEDVRTDLVVPVD